MAPLRNTPPRDPDGAGRQALTTGTPPVPDRTRRVGFNNRLVGWTVRHRRFVVAMAVAWLVVHTIRMVAAVVGWWSMPGWPVVAAMVVSVVANIFVAVAWWSGLWSGAR